MIFVATIMLAYPFVPTLVPSDMNHKLNALTTEELVHLLSQERKKFIVAIDYGATASDLEEIRDQIKELEEIITAKRETVGLQKNEDRQSCS